MICLVDMEKRPSESSNPPPAASPTQHQLVPKAYLDDVRRRLEEIAGHRCLLKRYDDVTPDWLASSDIQALILSGNVTAWDAYDPVDLQPLMEIVRGASLPILGLCGGLQFIALAHGVDVGPMRELRPSEEDVSDGFGTGYLKEWGFTPVQVLRSDPLFAGLESPIFLEAHYWEVREAPFGFELLASTDVCRVQALRQIGTLVCGTQFHPEAYVAKPARRRNWLVNLVYPDGYTQNQLDGRRFLINFFREADILPKKGNVTAHR